MKYMMHLGGSKNIRFRYLFLLVFIGTLIAGLLFADRALLVRFFVVEGDSFRVPDLLVVLEGGSLNFSPTQERVDRLLELYREYPVNVLVCAYRIHKREIIEYLKAQGIKAEDIVKTEYRYEGKAGSGTYNNVLEILSAIESNHYKNIEVVTSPYHELRVSIIISSIIRQLKIDRKIYVKYGHINKSEIIETDNPRFFRILAHELAGIAGFYMNLLYSETKEYL